MELQELIVGLSNEGCTDREAIETATDLFKVDMLRKRFGDNLNELVLDEVIQVSKEASDEERKVFTLLNRMSRRERECYLLHHVELLSMGKISNMLGVSKGTVQKYLQRSKNKVLNNAAKGA